MNFKKPKEQVVQDAANMAYNAVSSNLSQLHFGSMSNLGSTISIAISNGIRAALISFMEDIYTDQEFEEDLGLRDKS